MLEGPFISKSDESFMAYYVDKELVATVSLEAMCEDTCWVINRLCTHRKLRNKGLATALMEKFVSFLDENKYDCELYRNPYGDLNDTQLRAFYMKFGFKDADSLEGLMKRIYKEGSE